uniref:YitT family protein n=1 Tax=Ammonifex degensii TaxID=42838 RepID=A0A7C1J8F8_9THEO
MFTRALKDAALFFVGTVLVALGLDLFLVPNKIAAGGVSGIATILHHLFGFPVGATMLALNIPLFLWCFWRLGFGVGFRSLLGTLFLSGMVDGLVPFLPALTADALLASLYGGVLVGVGLGLVFRAKATTGGTDLAAMILGSYVGINVGQLLFLVDGAVVLAAGFAFRSPELAMYAIITIFLSAWVIDLVQEGISYTKAFLIVSEHHKAIARVILTELNRGATLWEGTGAYTGMPRTLLLAVVSRSEVTQLKEAVYRIDPRAFVILVDAHEVLGEGFKEFRAS